MDESPANPKKARLLCVDDDPRFLTLFTAVLEASGYNVVTTNDPRNVLELAAGTNFDLVILDYDMPHMNGAELACRLKEQKCDLPIVLFSGNLSVPANVLSVVDEHVAKGQGMDLLLQTLHDKVRRRPMRT